ICTDYRNLNLATPKDEYPMPMADLLVDGAAKHELLSFMDGHAGYNQIFIAEEDIHKTAFRCPGAIGTYEWVVMPFGLKNAGATYQRAMNLIFHDLIGRTIEVYIDDVVVKSPSKADHPGHLHMTIPTKVKDIQSLTGHVAALTRFISKATDRCAPFFKALKGSKRGITWTAECDKAFSELKEYMSRAPLLSTPEPGEFLMIYLSVSATTVSSVLIRLKESAEHPVHYVSKALQ
ncbi:unnamed protein product, partial [Prunus brigantina]